MRVGPADKYDVPSAPLEPGPRALYALRGVSGVAPRHRQCRASPDAVAEQREIIAAGWGRSPVAGDRPRTSHHGARGGREPDGSGGGCGVYENRAAQFPNWRGRAARISGSYA